MTKFIPPPNDKRKRGGGDDDEDGAAADDEDADLSKVSFFCHHFVLGNTTAYL